jgi:hypothetical protein
MPLLGANILLMVAFLSIVLTLILTFLGLLHFYWVAGGAWGLEGAMTITMRESVSRSERQFGFRILTVIVGLGLLFAGGTALSYLTQTFPAFALPYRPWFTLALAGLFTLRALGDFKEVGLFAKKGDDVFSIRDRSIYTPLCLLVAVLWGGLYLMA